ncbi:Holliday junction resolvase [Skermanella stibiiresistens SB22]|uniref:Putative pre-16S rRNA nuclease n=1 Tax=Skermanella stibiiresistens SB22 TaxID=1385369 RepID=W9H763_9PROT|nr:Holliday junction resolvase RuvX [Skermanella stibiiresistens]EWY41884.1 Holliday junction resolvase [Skermanella stibiiresistens SB22]
MAIRKLTDLPTLVPRGKRLLGLDTGSKTIGMAISDPGFSVASPIGTIKRTKFTADARELARYIKDREVGAVVIGLPVNMDGSEGPAAERARQFAASMIEHKDLLGGELDIAFWDERLSTSAVQRMMIDADMTRKRRAEVVDKMAAAYILQGALDALSRFKAANAPPEDVHWADRRDDGNPEDGPV